MYLAWKGINNRHNDIEDVHPQILSSQHHCSSMRGYNIAHNNSKTYLSPETMMV